MRQLILFLATAAMIYLCNSLQARNMLENVSGQDISRNTFTLICAIIAGLAVVLIDASFDKEDDDIIEDFNGVERRYTTNPTNQYVPLDSYDRTPFFQVPADVNQFNQPRFDRFSKYFIGRNEGLVHKYSAAREAPENCIKAKRGELESTAQTVFSGKPLSYYRALSVNSGMPLYRVNWKN
jgi:hypothetical protein